MPDQLFDIIFLGGGPAGYQGAIRSAQLGQRVAVVENRELGGVCLNRGCIPTKTIKASVDLLLRARQAKSYGLEIDNVRPNIEAIIARKDKVVGLLRGGIEQLFRAHKVVLYQGCGRFLSPREIQVEMKDARVRLTADKIVIATGSRTFIPSQFAGMLPGLITSDEILDLTAVPSSLIIVGAGAIGVEMASIMAGLGSEVTVVEMQERILPTEDLEMVSYLLRMLKRQKIKIITGVTVADFRPGTRVQVSLSNGQALEADAVLVAAGRIPNTDAIGLEAAGLATQSGFLKVNEQMETEVNGIYAAGDVVGGWLLAHVAFAEGIVAAENAAGLESSLDYRVVPRCIYSVPEFAAVGLSAEEAHARYPSAAYSFPLKSLGMAQALGEWEGLIKLVVDRKNGTILGGHIIGAHASDLIAEIALAMQNNIPIQGIVDTIHAHPSMAEAVLEIAQAASGQAIHLLPAAEIKII